MVHSKSSTRTSKVVYVANVEVEGRMVHVHVVNVHMYGTRTQVIHVLHVVQ